MTIIEKQERLRSYCVKRLCKNCALKDFKESCYQGPDWVIERNYDLVFNKVPDPDADVVTYDAVNHPAHYQGKHECIDEMIALFGVEAVKAFCKCNVYKYRFRAANKNGQEDLDKADWYMDKLMELEKGENGNGKEA